MKSSVARGAEDGERHAGARLAVRIAGARRQDPGDVVPGERNAHRHSRAARHAGKIHPPGIDGEPSAHVRAHRLRRLHRAGVGTVPGVVGCRDDVAVLLGGGPVFLDHEAPARRRVEREKQAPFALWRISGRQVERVGLRRVVSALDRVDDRARLKRLRSRARRVHARDQGRDDEPFVHRRDPTARTEPRGLVVLRLVPWKRDGLQKSRSAAPGWQGATTEHSAPT